MRIRKRICGGVTIGLIFSTLVHAGAGGGLYYLLQVDDPQPVEVELDLSLVPLVRTVAMRPPEPVPAPTPVPSRTGPTPEVPPPPAVEETLPARGRPLVLPTRIVSPTHDGGARSAPSPDPGPPPSPVVAEAPPEPQEPPPELPGAVSEPVDVAATTPPDLTARYLPAAQLARQPRWIANFITPEDYPLMARRHGKDGRVVLSVFIDEAGRVHDVRLLQGSYDVLNEVALRKTREAIFTPAYNEDGQHVACTVALPIRFELQ